MKTQVADFSENILEARRGYNVVIHKHEVAARAVQFIDPPYYGSLSSKYEHFREWKRLEEGDAGVVDMETLLKGICSKKALLARSMAGHGYRRVTALLNAGGIEVGKDRVQRIWRREGLKVPKKQPKRSRLWLNDGSCIRLRPLYPNHVWSFDFVEARNDGRRLRLMTLIDEFSRRCLAIHVARRINALDVIEALADVMLVFEGIPAYIRSDNGPEMVAKVLRQWLKGLGSKSLYIEPGSPWENGYGELFNGKLRDELLNARLSPR